MGWVVDWVGMGRPSHLAQNSRSSWRMVRPERAFLARTVAVTAISPARVRGTSRRAAGISPLNLEPHAQKELGRKNGTKTAWHADGCDYSPRS